MVVVGVVGVGVGGWGGVWRAEAPAAVPVLCRCHISAVRR